MELGNELGLDDADDPAEKKKKLPFLQRRYAELKEGLDPTTAAILDTVLFVVSLLYLGFFVSAALPWEEPFALAWVLPAPSVALIVLLFALSAFLGRRPYGFVMPLIAVLVLLPMRLYRWADLAVRASLGRGIEGTDAASFQDLMVYFNDTMPFTTLTTNLLVWVVAVGLGVFLARQALAACFNYLRHPKPRLVVVAAILLLGLASLVLPADDDHWGAFSPPRGLHMLMAFGDSLGQVPDAEAKLAQIRDSAARLQSAANTLDLDERHVLFIMLSSYGSEVFGEPHRSALNADLRAFEDGLSEAEVHVRSHQLIAPVRGAQSELAAATFISGTRMTAPGQLDLLRQEQPTTLATIFGQSGYATLHVMPGINREGPLEPFRFYGFFSTYRAWELGYKGPTYGMVYAPDQYTLDHIHRREIENATRPVFMQIELAGMRPPWAEQPPYVEDWSTLDDGSLYEPLPPVTYPVEGFDFNGAVGAYQASVRHTLRVLKQYLTEEALRAPADDSNRRRRRRRRNRRPAPLYVVVGSHPPLVQASPGLVEGQPNLVPIHVLSRDPSVLEPFEARGYLEGIEPPQAQLPMEDFAHAFAEDFGTAQANE